jgi:histidinol-phosphate aminotransferase
MSELVNRLLSPALKQLKPYESARRLFSEGDLWLNANESPFANDYQLNSGTLNRYPDCQPKGLIEQYAKYAGVETEQCLVTRGADEGIELLIRTFCTPHQDAVLICPPTYGMYAISAQSCYTKVEIVPTLADFSLDLEAIKTFKGKVNLVFLCSPNNPTGTLIAAEQIQSVLEHFADSALVVVDEAYIEFCPEQTWASQLSDYPNLVVLRTLSKGFALAGLRCGFTLANSSVIQALLKVIAPYPVSAPVAQIAEQALSDQGIGRMRQQVSLLNSEKQKLKATLSRQAAIQWVGQDHANFLLFRTAPKQALMDYLVASGIVLRDQSKQPQLHDCLRISIGDPEQNQRLVQAITTFYETNQND